MRRVAVIATALSLSALGVAPALAKGPGERGATAGFDSTPDGTQAGRPWYVAFTVFGQNGRPMRVVNPQVEIEGLADNRTEAFAARPAAGGGYTATVTF